MSKEGIGFDLSDASATYDTVLNTNCCVDAFNVVYLSGCSVVFHNTFQNHKMFVQRQSTSQVRAMAHFSANETNVALLTLHQDNFAIEIYTHSTAKKFILPFTSSASPHDIAFLDKSRILLLDNKEVFLFHTHNPNKQLCTLSKGNMQFKKIIISQRRIFLLLSKGIVQFNPQSECLHQHILHDNLQIVDFLISENQYQIIGLQSQIQLYSQSNCILTYPLPFKLKHMICSGKHLLLSKSQEITLYHYIVSEGNLECLGEFTYKERSRGQITALRLSGDEMTVGISLVVNKRMEIILFNMAVLCSQKKFVEAYRRVCSAQPTNTLSLQSTLCDSVCYLAGQNVVEWGVEKRSYALHEHARQLLIHPLMYQYVCLFEANIKFYHKVESQIIEVWSESVFCTAAKYSCSGMLILALVEDDCSVVVLYDPSAFRRVRTITSLSIKHSITKIDVDPKEKAIAVYCARDLFIHRLKTGQKVGEFRGKTEGGQLQNIVYDWEKRMILAAGKRKLLQCRKMEECCMHYNQQKWVQLPQDASCLRINQSSLFVGLMSGKVLHTTYPLIIDQCTNTILSYEMFRVHFKAIQDIQMSNRMLFISVVNGGVALLRIRSSVHPHPLSAYDFIQSSSKTHIDSLQERLKILVEKRKTVFNELEEMKKECEMKRQQLLKDVANGNKRRELECVQQSLLEIQEKKKKKEMLAAKLVQVMKMSAEEEVELENKTNKELLILYAENDELLQRRDNMVEKCRVEREEIERKFKDNIEEIRRELREKYSRFQRNNKLMVGNIVNLKKRKEIQDMEDRELVAEEEVREEMSLRERERELIHSNNEIKSELARRKKQLDRYKSREDFIENKERFFKEEMRQGEKERRELEEAKEQLERQLEQLQQLTLKKQRRLKKYFVENNVLQKYQSVHNHLTQATNRELQFLQKQKATLAANIVLIQKQISDVAQQKQRIKRSIVQKKQLQQSLIQGNTKLKQKVKYAEYMQEMLQNEIMRHNSSNSFGQIHKKYFQQKELDNFIGCNEEGAQTNDSINELNHKNQLKIKQVLQDHKEYLHENMRLFQKHNSRVNEQIILHQLKYQTQNYDLIAQCNEKKEQTAHKKKVVNELMEEVRETHKIINRIGRNESVVKSTSMENIRVRDGVDKVSRGKGTQCSTPFINYEREKWKSASEAKLLRRYQVKKVLEVQKMPLRRIQTAKQKYNEVVMSMYCPPESVHCEGQKPLTAAYAHRRRVIYKKENQKNTTCPSQSKHSTFV